MGKGTFVVPPRCLQWDPMGHDRCLLEKGHNQPWLHVGMEMKWEDARYLLAEHQELWPRGRPRFKDRPAPVLPPMSRYDGDPHCFYCGELMDPALPVADPDRWTIDHVIPISRGGSKTLANSVGACAFCNSNKANLLVSEWVEYLESSSSGGSPVALRKEAAVIERYRHGLLDHRNIE